MLAVLETSKEIWVKYFLIQFILVLYVCWHISEYHYGRVAILSWTFAPGRLDDLDRVREAEQPDHNGAGSGAICWALLQRPVRTLHFKITPSKWSILGSHSWINATVSFPSTPRNPTSLRLFLRGWFSWSFTCSLRSLSLLSVVFFVVIQLTLHGG